jgi:hypothetical protein
VPLLFIKLLAAQTLCRNVLNGYFKTHDRILVCIFLVCIFLANGPLANNEHARPTARHFWLAHDAALLLRGETAKAPERTYRNGLTSRILDAAGVISPYQAVLGNPIPLDI